MTEEKSLIPRGSKQRVPRTALLAGGAILGVLLLLFGGGVGRDVAEQEVSAEASAEMEAYARALEEKIRIFCQQVEGVGRASVTVSLESGYRRVYATEGADYVLVGSGSGRGTVYLTDQPPAIGGIAVICEGGGDAAVRRRLIGLLTAAYGIGANKIYIAPGTK